jgi:hypothetical protein
MLSSLALGPRLPDAGEWRPRPGARAAVRFLPFNRDLSRHRSAASSLPTVFPGTSSGRRFTH